MLQDEFEKLSALCSSMDDSIKFDVRTRPEIAVAWNFAALGNIAMHQSRIEIQKAYFQYIKVEPYKPSSIRSTNFLKENS